MLHRPTLRETLRYGRGALPRPRWRRPPTCGAFPTWPFTLMGGPYDYVAPGMHDSLQAYWKMEEASGTRNDAHSTNHLTDNNTVTQGTGIRGYAASFASATQESLSIADNAALSVADIDMSIAVWAYLNSTAAQRAIVSKHDPAGNQRAYTMRVDTTTLFFRCSLKDGSQSGDATYGSAFTTGAWHFIVAWHDATANTVNIQVDNGSVNSTGYTFGMEDNTPIFEVGTGDVNQYWWDGLIDELAFAKRVWTSDERSYLWNGGLGRTYPLTTP